MTVRLLLDPPLPGPVNMARDELLLQQAVERGEAAVRWYEWSPATLSLGYFQADEPDVLPALPRVRRLSGGGAIRHDREWTYSLAAPSGVFGPTPDLYRRVHEAIIAELSAAGVETAMRGVDNPAVDGNFLCFERGDRHDILLGDRKVVGSAQRRRGGAVLQHGSVALTGPIAAAVEDGRLVRDAFVRGVTARFAGATDSEWSDAETAFAADWAERKYARLEWTGDLRRGPELPANV